MGVSPEQIQELIPERKTRLFRVAVGELDTDEYVRQVTETHKASGKQFNPGRWFCNPDELIHHGGNTYALSNQWGVHTAFFVQRLAAAFPDAEIVVKPVT